MTETIINTQHLQNIFGFQPADPEATEARRAQQLIITAVLRNLGTVVTVAQGTSKELSRELQKGFSTSEAVQSFADGLKKFEGQLFDSQEVYKRAVDLAREENFSASGKIMHEEAKRIFGLESINDPVSGVERQRIGAVLEALAAGYYVAEESLCEGTKRRPYRPTQEDINKEDDLNNVVLEWKENFWEAHRLAKDLDCPVKDNRNAHLPQNLHVFGIYRDNSRYYSDRKNFVVKAQKEGLI